MMGRLRLLLPGRLPFIEPPLPTLLLASSRHLPSLSPAPPTAAGGAGGRGSRLLLSNRLTLRREWLCTQAATPEAAAPDPVSSSYLSVSIRCSKHTAIMLSEALLCFGASSASMDEVSNLEDDDESCITSIFLDDQDVHACISNAANSIGLNYAPSYEVSIGEHCDWINSVQDTFHPIKVTDGLWVVPEWRTPIDLQATNIILDPGMAFGTGEHPTTKLCLMLLHGLIRGGEFFLDYGTGSGVLGIAAVKMGAALSLGLDIDPQAVTSACQNIALNKIESNRMLVHLIPRKLSPYSIDANTKKNPEEHTSYDLNLNAEREKFDIVIANILLNPLLELAEDIVAFGKPGSVIGVSRILSEQLDQIQELYSRFLENISVSEMDGWACLHGTKKCSRNFV